jgi:hypothetical protein
MSQSDQNKNFTITKQVKTKPWQSMKLTEHTVR